MKNSNHLGSFILLAIAFIPISTYSWEIANRRPIPFFLYDKDGDNLISKKEFSETRSERWPKKETSMLNEINTSSFIVFDKNNDGQLTQRELASGQQIQKNKRFNLLVGQDRGMNQEMRMRKNKPLFSEFDLNNDGKIIEQEFSEAHNKRMTKRSRQGYPMKNRENAPLFTDIDVNNDGTISPEEFLAH
ncbi:MAG: EF-hand domain-containing protein [Alteromonadaceae bacterium]|jgi:Ca2+-binding EF-hand superfamily protein